MNIKYKYNNMCICDVKTVGRMVSASVGRMRDGGGGQRRAVVGGGVCFSLFFVIRVG